MCNSCKCITDVTNSIKSQISKAGQFYDTLVRDKEMLKNVILTPRDKGRMLGELFAKDEILTLTQVGIVKREMDKPTYTYNCHTDSAWAMYNHITLALKESHPMNYLDNHQLVHTYFVNEFGQLITSTEKSEETVIEEEVSLDTEQESDVFGVNFL
jgi:hypothetical protein